MNTRDTAAQAVLDHTDIADLVRRVVGSVLLPGEAGYDSECATFNMMSTLRPAIAVGATSVADVQAAVRFAAERDLTIAALATGHQMVRSSAGAMLINISRTNAVHVEPARDLARVGGGSRSWQVLDEAGKYGLAPINGTSSTVGVVGYHLGGGASPILTPCSPCSAPILVQNWALSSCGRSAVRSNVRLQCPRFSEKIMLGQESEARCRFGPISTRFKLSRLASSQCAA